MHRKRYQDLLMQVASGIEDLSLLEERVLIAAMELTDENSPVTTIPLSKITDRAMSSYELGPLTDADVSRALEGAREVGFPFEVKEELVEVRLK